MPLIRVPSSIESALKVAEVEGLLRLCLRAGVPASIVLKAARKVLRESETPDPIKELVEATFDPALSFDSEFSPVEVRQAPLVSRPPRRPAWRAARMLRHFDPLGWGNRAMFAVVAIPFLIPLLWVVAHNPAAAPLPAPFTVSALTVSFEPRTVTLVSADPERHRVKRLATAHHRPIALSSR